MLINCKQVSPGMEPDCPAATIPETNSFVPSAARWQSLLLDFTAVLCSVVICLYVDRRNQLKKGLLVKCLLKTQSLSRLGGWVGRRPALWVKGLGVRHLSSSWTLRQRQRQKRRTKQSNETKTFKEHHSFSNPYILSICPT